MDVHRLKPFLESLRSIAWFSNAGEPCEDARVVHGLQSAWDGEGERTLDIWGRETRALEAKALQWLGGQDIDQIFSAVSDAIEEPLYNGLCNYLDRVYDTIHGAKKRTLDDGIFPEVLESVKRDVCWAAVEHALHNQGFFSNLLRFYRRGRWACSWDGNYPEGRPVLL